MIAPTDPRTPRVVLVGPPGAGKSTIGRKLAKELGVDLYDTDAGIERETGRTIPEIFAEDGEPEFRRIEERVVRRAILAERGVVSLGGGAVLSANTRALLRNRTVVYLEISVAEGLRRTGASNQRPLLNGDDPGAKYRELMRTRRPLYREVATVRVRTDGRSPSRVVRMILSRLGIESGTPEPEPGTTTEVTPRTQGTSRSRARRRARARAAARRRAAAGGEPGSAPTTAETTASNEPGTASGDAATPAPASDPASAPSTRSQVQPSAGSTDDTVANSASPGDASAATGRRRRPRRRRSTSSSRHSAGIPSRGADGAHDSADRPSDEPRTSAPGSDSVPPDSASRFPGDRNVTGTVPLGGSGIGPNDKGMGKSRAGTGADLAGQPGDGPNHAVTDTPVPPRRARRNRRSGRRRGSDGSAGVRADGKAERTLSMEQVPATGVGDRPVAPAEAGGSPPGGNRSRRARARRARNGGSSARGGASGTRSNALSVRGVQNAGGGASQQMARTESEQQS
ncbi:hypothetical protein IU449_07425 [Nocardia higoensis]|uniref:Shikimate kinase n=1 Tax=Nocardia higoensis TaxID=228599 RepID=A0ABS0D7L4_9NOCA|nr:hypothetical protein [Nocardia higoensis]